MGHNFVFSVRTLKPKTYKKT